MEGGGGRERDGDGEKREKEGEREEGGKRERDSTQVFLYSCLLQRKPGLVYKTRPDSRFHVFIRQVHPNLTCQIPVSLWYQVMCVYVCDPMSRMFYKCNRVSCTSV